MSSSKILVIDDKESICILVCELLEPLGYEVLQAADGKAGLELYRERTCRLVITDIGLPVMDGFEVIDAIRKEDTDTPILVLAGIDEEGLDERAWERGANAVIHKPFRIEELVSTVTELIANA